MARPLRIDFEGAYHHVTVRIINRSFWLKPDKIKALFLEILKKTTLKYDTVVIAFSIMDNHLHLILKSGKTALSKFMQVLLSSFAMKYNNLMHRKGHVFESRYQSFLIERRVFITSYSLCITESCQERFGISSWRLPMVKYGQLF
jgi:REP element-mobilizing transposase RayT